MPERRAGHLSAINGNKMYVMGWKCEGNARLNDVWQFDFDTKTWSKFDTKTWSKFDTKIVDENQ